MERHYNKEAFKQTVRKVWRLVKNISFKNSEPMMILVEFEDVKDGDRVSAESPW